MPKHLTLLGILVCFVSVGLAGEQVRIDGRVIDKETRLPLIANVIVLGTQFGTIARKDGTFSLAFRSDQQEFQLKVFLIGYKSQMVIARPGEFVEVELEVQPIPVSEIVVTPDASVGTDAREEIVTLTKLDIYRTPGAAADPLYAMQLLPGVNAPPDASSMLIQGGGADETLYLLDGIEVGHPFQVEAKDVCYFSIFDTQVVKRSRVTTAGFPAKYGDGLSGVVDFRTSEECHRSSGTIGVNMVGGSASIRLPLNWGMKLVSSYKGLRSGLMERIYGSEGTYSGGNLFISLKLPISGSTSARFLGLEDWYRFNRSTVSPVSFDSDNFIVGLGINTILRTAVIQSTVSVSNYTSDYALAEGKIGIDDRRVQMRSDWALDLDASMIEFGCDWSRRKMVVSKSFGDSIDLTFPSVGNRIAAYLSSRNRLSTRLFAECGIRSSALDLGGYKVWLEPRFSMAYFLKPSDIVRFSTGVYRQFGDYWYTREYSLKPRVAYHYLLSFDHINDQFTARVTVYDKEYRGLFLLNDGQMTNDGHGYARGAELFVKVDLAAVSVTAIYNFLDSKRKENEVTKLAPSPFEIDHSFTISNSLDLAGFT